MWPKVWASAEVSAKIRRKAFLGDSNACKHPGRMFVLVGLREGTQMWAGIHWVMLVERISSCREFPVDDVPTRQCDLAARMSI